MSTFIKATFIAGSISTVTGALGLQVWEAYSLELLAASLGALWGGAAGVTTSCYYWWSQD